MSFYNFFKNIFGIPSGSDGTYNNENQRPNDFYNDAERNRMWEEHEAENFRRSGDSFHGFNVFTDPIEIHRYFEQQMDEMMKSFQGFFRTEDSTPFEGFFGGLNDAFTQTLPPLPDQETNAGDLRHHYLKPGYEHAQERHPSKPQEDSDLDGKIDVGNLDSILGKSKSRESITPYQPQPGPSTSVFGTSVSSRRVQRPDGSVEIHKTTRDSQGNEETTITRQMGDKQYTVTTRRDKSGKEERIEDMVNMDEKDIDGFLGIWNRPKLPPPPSPSHSHDDPNRYFPFDKYFK